MQSPATRSEMLARRQQIQFAQQGRDLIWDKRTALMREFKKQQLDVLAELAALAAVGAAGRRALARAEAADGAAAVWSAALGSAPPLLVARRERSVAGVRVVEVVATPARRPPEARGWAPVLVSAHVDRVAEAYERYLQQVVRLCTLELTVRRLAAEIARATRQVNALENVVIPRLQAEARQIAIALEEREREEHGRLKRARQRRATRAAETNGEEAA